MIETFSYTADRVAREVEDSFGDVGNAQITRTMILTWINNGIREIALQHDVLESSASTNLLAGVNVYDLSALLSTVRIKSYSTITVSGKPLKLVGFPEYMGEVADADTTPGTPTFGTVRGSTLSIWPVPDATVTAGLTIYYAAIPADVATIDATLTIPDRFYNSLVAYVTAKALELDENFDAAQFKYGQHDAALKRELSRDALNPTDYYSTITIIDDDDYASYGPALY